MVFTVYSLKTIFFSLDYTRTPHSLHSDDRFKSRKRRSRVVYIRLQVTQDTRSTKGLGRPCSILKCVKIEEHSYKRYEI